jgi:uncharacterized protein (TIGR02246 family)
MNADEKEIRDLVAHWMRATRMGDIDTVLDLMSDDVLCLTPGQPPMDKRAFAAAARAQSGANAPSFDGTSEIQEIRVHDDWAYMWTRLSVTVSFSDGRPAMMRAGHTLSILKKVDGRWRLARDANLLVPVEARGTGG